MDVNTDIPLKPTVKSNIDFCYQFDFVGFIFPKQRIHVGFTCYFYMIIFLLHTVAKMVI